MKKSMLLLLGLLICLMTLSVTAQQKDSGNCKDHPAFTRMPDYWIYSCQQKQFEAYSFVVGKGKTELFEGQYWKIAYRPQNTLASKPSELQIQRNFENAVQKQGGEVLWSEKGRSTFKLSREGLEIWVELRTDFTSGYALFIIQKAAMAQDIVADAAAMASDINATGHVAVYGIYFDSGKSQIKPESAQAIAEIAKLLKGQPALKLFVVGHTDSQGGVEANIALSQDRAEAVLKALVGEHGIAPARLRSFGCGQFAPLASNDSDAGRARNRRVELVKQ
ncbi:MAG: OmpA family protein [Acidobacteria bacterium]|jgi:outer membrane protein OmpA-like peptidoglycan-associated protein|nr:OmpA family protein [Acidobacteriota bacterium]